MELFNMAIDAVMSLGKKKYEEFQLYQEEVKNLTDDELFDEALWVDRDISHGAKGKRAMEKLANSVGKSIKLLRYPDDMRMQAIWSEAIKRGLVGNDGNLIIDYGVELPEDDDTDLSVYGSTIQERKEAFAMIRERIAKYQKYISVSGSHSVALKSDGTVVATGHNEDGQCDTESWCDIVAVSAGDSHTVGLKADGTVIAIGDNSGEQCETGDWQDIIAIAAGGSCTYGLKADGTVILTDWSEDTADWRDIISIAAGCGHVVGLKSDGKVVAAGLNESGQCDVQDWRDIVAISAGSSHTVGLKSDGTVVAVGNNNGSYSFPGGCCNTQNWKGVVAVAAGSFHTVALKADGMVVAIGGEYGKRYNIHDWHDIVAISAGSHTIGLKKDGRVVAVGSGWECDVEGWQGIGPGVIDLPTPSPSPINPATESSDNKETFKRKLEDLMTMKEVGMLSDEEFETEKRRILDSL